MTHLVIGAGAAAISAVRTILREKPDDKVVVVSQDEEVYSRCMLHRFISGERDAESINFINDDVLKSPNVEWIRGKTITRLDGGAKTIYSGDEKVASGDTVLIATGSNSVTPPIGELKTAKNAFGLRHLSDARSIVGAAKNAKKIAVIGAGLVGLDAVYGILEAPGGVNKEITVIEMAPSALAINLDAHAAEAYQRLFEKKGVKFHLTANVVGTKSSGENINDVELDALFLKEPLVGFRGVGVHVDSQGRRRHFNNGDFFFVSAFGLKDAVHSVKAHKAGADDSDFLRLFCAFNDSAGIAKVAKAKGVFCGF
jgi:NAD(P)H-nitrite reductase large subunit